MAEFPPHLNEHLAATFATSSSMLLERGDDIELSSTEQIFLVESGAVVEILENDTWSHAVSFVGPGHMVGLRITPAPSLQRRQRALALQDTVLMSTDLRSLMICSVQFVSCADYIMQELAMRSQLADGLTTACHQRSTADHILNVLASAASVFGRDPDGRSRVPIMVPMLERMCGCPWVLVRSALQHLQESGIITVSAQGVRLQYHT
jgi:CRP-like cAMP-binding protein